MERLRYETPTPIQSQAIPAAMAGRDVIGIAKTGTSIYLCTHFSFLPRVGKNVKLFITYA